MSSEFCRMQARQMLEHLGISDPPVDVEAIAATHGLAVKFVMRPTAFAGQLVRELMLIEVNRRHHRHKQRFTIAHEIGHFVLGHSPVVSVFDDRGVADPGKSNERQANAFGSELLLPESRVRERWRELRRENKPIDRMAEVFDVSSEAMYYCLDSLDLLGMPPTRQSSRASRDRQY